MPEIRREMIGSDDLEEALMKKAFDSLIQRLARPATDIFLSYPRTKINRLKVLREYQMELMILDNFVEHGKMNSRGIIPFIANGKLGKFQFDLYYEERLVINKTKTSKDENKLPIASGMADSKKVDTDDQEKNHSKNGSKVKLGSNRQTILNKTKNEGKKPLNTQNEDNNTLKGQFKGMLTKPDPNQKQCHACTVFYDKKLNYCPTCDNKYDENASKKMVENFEDLNSDDILLKDTQDETASLKSNDKIVDNQNDDDFEIPKDAKNKETDSFDKLNFSPDSENLERIHVEIEGDINEFISCKLLISR
jgi:hypothetical protein